MGNAEVLKKKLHDGFMVERNEDMNDEYRTALIQTLLIVGDTELLSAPPLLSVYNEAPNLNYKITALAVIQDEIGHAHIAYRLLEDLGQDVEELLYNRKANRWKNPYAFDFKLDNWIHNKAIQKIRESKRIDKITKDMLLEWRKI